MLYAIFLVQAPELNNYYIKVHLMVDIGCVNRRQVTCSDGTVQHTVMFTFQRLHRRAEIVEIVKEQTIVGGRRDKEAELSCGCGKSSS